MTLTAAFRCTDGFVIAADTEITLRAVRVQGHKLLQSRLDEPYTLCIAFSGDVAYALAAGQRIFEAVRATTPTLANIRSAISTALAVFYEQHMRHNWPATGAETPGFDLMIGFQGMERDDGFGVVATANEVIYDVERAAFSGSGYDAASYVAERLLSGGSYSTAVTHHLAQQLFREVKGKGPYVGGNTEIMSRRCHPKATPFFRLPSLEEEKRAFWGLEDILWSSIRNALKTEFMALPGHKVAPLLEKRLKLLRGRIVALFRDCHDDRCVSSPDVMQINTTEFDTEIGNPWQDL